MEAARCSARSRGVELNLACAAERESRRPRGLDFVARSHENPRVGRQANNLAQLLNALKQQQLHKIAEVAGVTLSQKKAVGPIREELLRESERVEVTLADGLRKIKCGELKAVCRTLGLSDQGKKTEEVVQRLVVFANATPLLSAVAEVGDGARARKGERHDQSIFVVHGHDAAMRVETVHLLSKFGIKSIVLANEPNKGATIIEKLEQHISKSTHAIVLLSPDDLGHKIGHDGARQARARQNVILELGMVIGRLGRRNVIVLYRGDIELPSDIGGLMYIRYEHEDHNTIIALAKELKAMKYHVDGDALLR